MGNQFSGPSLKVQLKMASQRITINSSKRTNKVKVAQKALADLLTKEKFDSAAIRAEAVIADKNMLVVMEMLSLMCELLVTRLGLIVASKTCPPDLEQAVATIIYAHRRLSEITELTKIAEQFGAKYGQEWATTHIDNTSGKVNPKIIALLSVTPPAKKLVYAELSEVASTHGVAYIAPLVSDEEEPAPTPAPAAAQAPVAAAAPAAAQAPVANAGGVLPVAIPGIEAAHQQQTQFLQQQQQQILAQQQVLLQQQQQQQQQQQLQQQQPSSTPPVGPGTLNVVLHCCVELFDTQTVGRQDPYVKIGLKGQRTVLQSSVCSNGGTDPKWHPLEHFPFAVQRDTDGSDEVLVVAVFNKNTMHDSLIGRAFITAEDLVKLCYSPESAPTVQTASQSSAIASPGHPGRQRFQLLRGSENRVMAGHIELSAQFLPLHGGIPASSTSVSASSATPGGATAATSAVDGSSDVAVASWMDESAWPTASAPLPPSYDMKQPAADDDAGTVEAAMAASLPMSPMSSATVNDATQDELDDDDADDEVGGAGGSEAGGVAGGSNAGVAGTGAGSGGDPPDFDELERRFAALTGGSH